MRSWQKVGQYNAIHLNALLRCNALLGIRLQTCKEGKGLHVIPQYQYQYHNLHVIPHIALLDLILTRQTGKGGPHKEEGCRKGVKTNGRGRWVRTRGKGVQTSQMVRGLLYNPRGL